MQRENRRSLWPSREATRCHCRELARTPHLDLVCKVGCKEVNCVRSGKGSKAMPVDAASSRAAALFALGCIAWLPATPRLGHRWDHATAHLMSEMAVCNDREACEQRRQEKQGWDET